MKKIIFTLLVLFTILFSVNKSNASSDYFTPYPSCQNSVLEYRLLFYDPVYSTSLIEKLEQDDSKFAKAVKSVFSKVNKILPDASSFKNKLNIDYLNKICSLEKDEKEKFVDNISDYIFEIEYFKVNLYILYSLSIWDKIEPSEKEIILNSINESFREKIKSSSINSSLIKEYLNEMLSLKKANSLYNKIKID